MSFATLQVLARSDPRVFAESIKKYGLRIIGRRDLNPLKTQVQSESVQSIASTLTEDANIVRDMSSDVHRIKFLAEQYGYIVELSPAEDR